MTKQIVDHRDGGERQVSERDCFSAAQNPTRRFHDARRRGMMNHGD
jgi:hypothetical protein